MNLVDVTRPNTTWRKLRSSTVCSWSAAAAFAAMSSRVTLAAVLVDGWACILVVVWPWFVAVAAFVIGAEVFWLLVVVL